MRDLIPTATQDGHPHQVMAAALQNALADAVAYRDNLAQIQGDGTPEYEAAEAAVRNVYKTLTDTFGLRRRLTLDESDFRSPGVDAYRPGESLRYDEASPAGVNWSALGTCSPAEARAYAALIMRAADWAEGLS